MKSTTNKIKTTLAGVAALFAVFAPSFVSAQESSTYTVKEGDTLSEIAETHNTTVEKLAENNHIDNIHMIYVGQELVIDGPAAPVKESGGSYTATNGQYIGRYQLTDSYLNGDYSAENQERVADAYVAGRYGSWTAAKNFWLNNGWY